MVRTHILSGPEHILYFFDFVERKMAKLSRIPIINRIYNMQVRVGGVFKF